MIRTSTRKLPRRAPAPLAKLSPQVEPGALTGLACLVGAGARRGACLASARAHVLILAATDPHSVARPSLARCRAHWYRSIALHAMQHAKNARSAQSRYRSTSCRVDAASH